MLINKVLFTNKYIIYNINKSCNKTTKKKSKREEINK